MGTHRPYHEILGHPHDFEVEYRILTEEEGGRKTLPRQGIRWDFVYPNDEFQKYGAFMIWPEYLDENGEVILSTDISVPKSGKARMWIINPERREFHRTRIKEGLVGHSVEGPRKVAECVVTKIVGLPTNPTTQEELDERKTTHNNR